MERLERLLSSNEPAYINPIDRELAVTFVKLSNDDQLIFLMRAVIVELAIRLAGDNPSVEGAEAQLMRVLELTKEGLENE